MTFLKCIEYAMLDDRTCIQPNLYDGEFCWNMENNILGWSCLLGDIPIGAPGTSYYIVPARATDLSGLPPAFIIIGALDLFLEENLAHAKKLIASGVPTELVVYPGLVHGGNLMVPEAQLSKRILRDTIDAIRRHIGVKN
eukprot:Phypoly_transcript_11090.p1 GENE.Phypoly_transcript_11090~~Phypoly_transcript_11090.p1  ORF type:complete len:140 (-),score=11.82 Phypoly_transcript_11090:361-780(-)